MSERQKQILYINTYIWALVKWYWWSCVQDRNRDTDVENGLVDTMEELKGGTSWKSNDVYIYIYILPYVIEAAI